MGLFDDLLSEGPRLTVGAVRGAVTGQNPEMPAAWTAQEKARAMGVNPLLLSAAARAAETGIDIRPGHLGGVRDQATQDRLVAQGRSMTRNSNHMTGNAIDLWPAGNPNASADQYGQMAVAMKAAMSQNGNPVTWGGDWKSFVDKPHFEMNGRRPPLMAAGEMPLEVSARSRTSSGLFNDLISDNVAPVTDAPTKITVNPSKPDIGYGKAAMEGLRSGVTMNFGDELAGIAAASGLPGWVPDPLRFAGGVARAGADALMGRDDARKSYEVRRDEVRGDQKTAQEQYPGTYLAGQVGGAIALPGGPAMQAATLPARMGRSALVGAAFGGASGAGEGETLPDRATKAATGGAIGLGVGAAAPPILNAIGGAVNLANNRLVEPVRNAIRGERGVEREASRRVVGSLENDLRQSGPQPVADWSAARAAGQPVTIADMGGETTRALARSSADTSPAGRQLMNKVFDERYEGQYGRVRDWVNKQFSYPDATSQKAALKSAASAANNPAYLRAERNPNAAALWDEGFEQIASAPVVQNAIRQATVTGRNSAAMDGFRPPFANPFQIDKTTGMLSLKTDASGQKMIPGLRFWDEVKKNLDGIGTQEARSFARVLREHIDDLVPEYKAARQGAKSFFDAEDAIEAGQNFVGLRKDLGEARVAFARLSRDEKSLFRDGFLSRFVEDLGNVGDRRDVLLKINDNPNARAKLEMVLGKDKWRELEARLHIEEIMNLPRTEVQGNSKTARYLYQIGMAGGGGLGGIGTYNTDPQTMAYGAVLAAISHRGKHVDERIARRVAEMLVSKDPQTLTRGINIVSRSRAMMDSIRSFQPAIGRVSGQQNTDALSGPAIAAGRAEDQPDGPRPPGQ